MAPVATVDVMTSSIRLFRVIMPVTNIDAATRCFGGQPSWFKTSEGWAHFEFTRINTTPTFIPKKLEDLHETHEYMTVPNLSSADGEVDLRIRGL
jgi:hypothetical protein